MFVTIVGIKPRSKWKFWKIDDFEVTVEINGKMKNLTIYLDGSADLFLFLHYCINKFFGFSQYRKWSKEFWDITYNAYYEVLFIDFNLGSLIGKTFKVPS